MKEIDDTEIEIEGTLEDTKKVVAANAIYALEKLDELNERIDRMLKQIANLETQRTPQDENDDPEWYA